MVWFKLKDKKNQKIFNEKLFLQSHINWMKIVGLWPLYEIKNENYYVMLFSKIFIFIYNTFWKVIAFHIAILHHMTIIKKLKNGGTLDDISDLLMLAMIYSYAFFITIYFQFRHERFKELIRFVLKNMRLRSANGLTYFTIEQNFKSCYQKNTLWMVVCALGTLHWSVTPILLQQKILPLRCEYPFDPLISPRYEIIYLLQFFGQIQVGIAFGISGGLFMGIVTYICGQYDLLFCSLKNVRNTAMIMHGDVENVRKIQKVYDPSKEEEYQYATGNEILENLDEINLDPQLFPNMSVVIDDIKLQPIRKHYVKEKDKFHMKYCDELNIATIDCVKQHQIILKMTKMLENIYHPFVFGKVLQTTFLICFLTFIVSRTTHFSMQVVNFLEYLSLTSSELLLFCYFGESLAKQSIRVGDAAMRSPWYLCNGSFRRTIQIIMANSLKPILLTGGKFYILDFERYRSVITASFSYYTLLKNMGERQTRNY